VAGADSEDLSERAPSAARAARVPGGYDPSIARLFLATRAVVLGAAPRASELIYDAYSAVTVAYSFSDRLKDAFCHVAAYRKHVNLGFNRGASLDDPESRLVGTGARIRHVKIEARRICARRGSGSSWPLRSLRAASSRRRSRSPERS
jgi:hypothetical protein